MAFLLILLSSLFRGKKVNCLGISNKPLEICRFRCPTLSLHHVSTQKNRHVRQHKRAGVIVKTKKRKQHVVTSTWYPCLPLAHSLPTPCEAFAFLAALREKNYCRGIFFSPSRKGCKGEAWIFLQRLITAYALLAATFHDSSRLMLAIARLAQKIVRRWGSLEEAEFFITPV